MGFRAHRACRNDAERDPPSQRPVVVVLVLNVSYLTSVPFSRLQRFNDPTGETHIAEPKQTLFKTQFLTSKNPDPRLYESLKFSSEQGIF